jgi:hypothetical protein
VDKELTSSIEKVRSAVKEELTHYLAEQRDYLTGIASELIPVCDALEDYLLEGGKRQSFWMVCWVPRSSIALAAPTWLPH